MKPSCRSAVCIFRKSLLLISGVSRLRPPVPRLSARLGAVAHWHAAEICAKEVLRVAGSGLDPASAEAGAQATLSHQTMLRKSAWYQTRCRHLQATERLPHSVCRKPLAR